MMNYYRTTSAVLTGVLITAGSVFAQEGSGDISPQRSATSQVDDFLKYRARPSDTQADPARDLQIRLDLNLADADSSFSLNLGMSQDTPEADVIDANLPAGLKMDEKLQFTDDMYSLGMMHPPDVNAPAAGHPNLAEAATNPTAPLVQFQFQNTFIFESNAGSGYSHVTTIQPVVPWKMGEQQWISRFTLPLIATPDFGAPDGREYGVGDFVAINFANFAIKEGFWKGTIGIGPAFTLPTASSDFTGSGKYQAGPGIVYINTASPTFQWGVLVYQQTSFASSGGDSDRPETSQLFLQPILTWHFAKNWYLSNQSQAWSINWNDNDRWSLPIGVQLGHITKLGNMPAKIYVEPFWDISGNNTGNEWGIQFNITLLFPEGGGG